MKESSQALRAYQDYAAQDPPRSLQRLVEVYRRGIKGAPPTRKLRRLKEWSAQHRWQERIVEHERRLAEEREAEEAERRRRMREVRIAVAIELMHLGARALRSLSPEQMSVRDIVALLHFSFETQRKDLGEPDVVHQHDVVAGSPLADIQRRLGRMAERSAPQPITFTIERVPRGDERCDDLARPAHAQERLAITAETVPATLPEAPAATNGRTRGDSRDALGADIGVNGKTPQVQPPMPDPSAMTADERQQQRWQDLVEGRAWRR